MIIKDARHLRRARILFIYCNLLVCYTTVAVRVGKEIYIYYGILVHLLR